jgi:hypothetical protein
MVPTDTVYSNASVLFWSLMLHVGDWAMDPCNRETSLLEEARALQDDAKSCGLTGQLYSVPPMVRCVLCHSNPVVNLEPTLYHIGKS